MARGPDRARLENGRLILGEAVVLAFQRVPTQEGGRPPAWPAAARSFGLAPMFACRPGAGGREERSFAACLREGEAMWLGLHAADPGRAVELRVAERARGAVRRVRLLVPPGFALAGGGEATIRLLRDPGLVLAVRAGGAAVRLVLLAPAEFSAATGARPPAAIRPEDGYGGWRLP